MERKHAHFENQEPFFEDLLCSLRFRRIIKHVPEDSKILDVGCGYRGKLLYKVRNKISAGFGLDISVNRKLHDGKIALIKHDLSQPLPFENNSFDAVTSLANLEHLENPDNILREIHRVLKPGGILLLTTPSTFGKPVLELLAFLRLLSRQEIADHKKYFNKKILTNLCRQASFRDVKHQYFQLGMNNFLFASK